MNSYDFEHLLRGPLRAAMVAMGHGRIARIVPVAWPLLKSEWKVSVSVSEPVGMVDRFLLKALQTFGPCSTRELDSLLFLGEDRTEAAIEEMIRVGAPIKKEEDGLYCVESAEPIEQFENVRTHRFEFLINGLSGDLLPSTMLSRMKRCVLSEEDFVSMPWLPRLKPILSGEESPARRNLDPSKALNASDSNGIPFGFREFISKTPIKESIIFALGFLFVDVSGNETLLAATESAELITAPEGYIASHPLLRQGALSGFERFIAEVDSSRIRLKFREPGTNTISLSVLDNSIWSRFDDNERPSLDRRLVSGLLRSGWYWHRSGGPFHYCFFELCPGDVQTEHAMVVQRAAQALADHAEEISDNPSFSAWLTRFLEENGTSDGLLAVPPSQSEVLDAALERKEGEILSLASRLKESERGPEEPPEIDRTFTPQRQFFDSSSSEFGLRIVNLIREARDSVCIVSPVIQEDEVYAAIHDATQRNVSVKVVTQLGNHRTGQFETSPEFKSYAIPRRQLAQLGASVRDWDVTVHAKMILVDDEKFLFMSSNLNGNSLGLGTNNAVESALLFEHGPEVTAGRELFNAIWDGSTVRQIKRDDRIAIVRQGSKAKVPDADDCIRNVGRTEFILSTPTNQFLPRRIAALLREAQKSVLLSAMSIYDLERVPILFEALSGALARGVEVTVRIRNGVEQFKASDWPDPSTKKLMDQGLKIIEVSRLHAKGVFVDGKIGMVMSANLNPYSLGDLETSHVEMAVQAPCSTSFMRDAFSFFSSSAVFQRIEENPYNPWAGGAPATDQFFVGRDSLMKEIESVFSKRAGGNCYVLVGQKRSGKTSVVQNLASRLDPSHFHYVNLGDFDIDEEDFFAWLARGIELESPTFLQGLDGHVSNRPKDKILLISRNIQKAGKKFVIAIDEFSRLYEVAKSSSEDQKRVVSLLRWFKAALGSRAFHLLIVGQESMMQFKEAFPNEFAVTKFQRLSYLSKEDTKILADRPIQYNKQSRYQGEAFDLLFSLTAGYPFFVQIFCERLVDTLNEARQTFITEPLVAQACRSLCIGDEALQLSDFDPFIDLMITDVSRDQVKRFYRVLSDHSTLKNGCPLENLELDGWGTQLLNILVDRGIISTDGVTASIRMGLFGEWIRAQSRRLSS